MTQTDALHYVKPITPYSLSIMLTREKYPEHDIRGEAIDRQLNPLNNERKLEILELFRDKMEVSNKKKYKKIIKSLIADRESFVLNDKDYKRFLKKGGLTADDLDMD